MTTNADNLRELFRNPGISIQPAIFDPLGARIAEEVGFECIGLGGYAVGAHRAISEPLLDLSDIASIARSITLVTRLPLIVDAGAGYGEPLHVRHTTGVLEQAGAAAIHIEDQVFPKRAHYHKAVEHIIPMEAMVEKVRAAVAVRKDMMIIARTDAMRTDGYQEGIRRARAYVEAGAEALIFFPNNEEETRQAPKDIPDVPLIYVNSTGNSFGRGVFPAARLGEWGWAMVEDAISAANVTSRALYDYLTTLKQTGDSGLDAEEVKAVRRRLETTIGLERLYQIEAETVER